MQAKRGHVAQAASAIAHLPLHICYPLLRTTCGERDWSQSTLALVSGVSQENSCIRPGLTSFPSCAARKRRRAAHTNFMPAAEAHHVGFT